MFEMIDVYLDKFRDGYEQREIESSPLTYIHSEAPPFLLFHGLNDQWLRIEHTDKFVAALRAEGVQVEFIEIPGVDQFVRDYGELKKVQLEHALDETERLMKENI